jgi:excisionase family DNA binding protein
LSIKNQRLRKEGNILELLTIKDVCAQLKISRWTVSKLIKKGDLKPIMVSERYRFKQEDINKLLEKSK